MALQPAAIFPSDRLFTIFYDNYFHRRTVFFSEYHRRMRVLLVLTFITVVTPAAFAQSPTKILKAAEKAMGGQRAVRAVQSAEFTGTIKNAGDGSSGKFSMKIGRPGLYYVKYDIGGFEHEAGSNGRSAWVRDSRDGLRTLTGDASNGFNAMAAFRSSLWLDHKKERAKLASAGAATVNGKPVNVILLTTSKNVP